MIKLVRLSLLLLSILILSNCNSKQYKSPKTTRTVICGKITTPNARDLTKDVIAQVKDFRAKESVFVSEVDSNNMFKLVFDLYKTQDVRVLPIVGRILVSPGDSIFINLDLKRPEKISFEGDDRFGNKNMIEYLYSNYSSFKTSNVHTGKMKPLEYKAFLDEQLKKIEYRKKVFIETRLPSKELISWINSYINITYYTALIHFPLQYHNFNQKAYFNWEAPDGYFNNIDVIEDIAESYVINAKIYELINYYNWILIPNKLDNIPNNANSIDSFILNYIEDNTSDLLKEFLTGDIFYTYVTSDSLNLYNKNHSFLKKNVKSAFIKKPLEILYSKKEQELDNGGYALQTELIELNKDSNIVDQIIADNKGSNIYIDFWATWCNPCLDELPYSKKLFDSYAFTNIEFVFVCLDSEKDAWKQKLIEMQIPGRHYFCNKKQSEAIRKELGIETIPFYTLVDYNGEISDKGNHIRPSVPLTIKKINKLLQP